MLTIGTNINIDLSELNDHLNSLSLRTNEIVHEQLIPIETSI